MPISAYATVALPDDATHLPYQHAAAMTHTCVHLLPFWFAAPAAFPFAACRLCVCGFSRAAICVIKTPVGLRRARTGVLYRCTALCVADVGFTGLVPIAYPTHHHAAHAATAHRTRCLLPHTYARATFSSWLPHPAVLDYRAPVLRLRIFVRSLWLYAFSRTLVWFIRGSPHRPHARYLVWFTFTAPRAHLPSVPPWFGRTQRLRVLRATRGSSFALVYYACDPPLPRDTCVPALYAHLSPCLSLFARCRGFRPPAARFAWFTHSTGFALRCRLHDCRSQHLYGRWFDGSGLPRYHLLHYRALFYARCTLVARTTRY